jgi:hypothetical protein
MIYKEYTYLEKTFFCNDTKLEAKKQMWYQYGTADGGKRHIVILYILNANYAKMDNDMKAHTNC